MWLHIAGKYYLSTKAVIVFLPVVSSREKDKRFFLHACRLRRYCFFFLTMRIMRNTYFQAGYGGDK
jgi:hypothetical protein